MEAKSQIITEAKAEPSRSESGDRTVRDLDQAFWYVQESSIRNDVYPASASDLRALRRKVDWHIVPIMFCCYTMQFIDKVLLNVSRSLLVSAVCKK